MVKELIYMPLVLILAGLLLVSCDPDVAKEGVTMSPISVPFKVLPDSDGIHINDTILITSSIPNTNNLNQGTLEVKFNIFYCDSIPKTNANQTKEVYNNIDYLLINAKGNIVYNSGVQGLVLGLSTTTFGDSIQFSYKFIPYKKGLYTMGFSSSFYEGLNAKARANAFFEVENHFWSYYQVSGQDLPLPGSDEYKRYYFIAVTD